MRTWATRVVILLSALTLVLGLASFRRAAKRGSVSRLGVNPVVAAFRPLEFNRTSHQRDNRAANPYSPDRPGARIFNFSWRSTSRGPRLDLPPRRGRNFCRRIGKYLRSGRDEFW